MSMPSLSNVRHRKTVGGIDLPAELGQITKWIADRGDGRTQLGEVAHLEHAVAQLPILPSAESGSAQLAGRLGIEPVQPPAPVADHTQALDARAAQVGAGVAGDEHGRSGIDGAALALDERAERPAVVTVPVAGDHAGDGHEQPRSRATSASSITLVTSATPSTNTNARSPASSARMA